MIARDALRLKQPMDRRPVPVAGARIGETGILYLLQRPKRSAAESPPLPPCGDFGYWGMAHNRRRAVPTRGRKKGRAQQTTPALACRRAPGIRRAAPQVPRVKQDARSLHAYRQMLLIRRFEEKEGSSRLGLIGGCATLHGQRAVRTRHADGDQAGR